MKNQKTSARADVVLRVSSKAVKEQEPVYHWIGDKTEVMLIRLAGEVKAFQSICPHMGAQLTFERETQSVLCPWHGLRYDVTTKRSGHSRYKQLCEIEVEENEGEVIIRG